MRHEHWIIRHKRGGGRIRTGCIALCCLLLSAWAEAGLPVISNQRVTDVATRSFSVVLTVSEPSTAALLLFAADCTTPATGFVTDLQQNPASGNMRFTVSGLAATTNYCYQLSVTSLSTSELITTPTAPVTTTAAIVRTSLSGPDLLPVGNDILKVPAVYLTSGETSDAVIATIELLNGTAGSPLSLLLSTNQNRDYFNLNNLFSTATGATLILSGGERVKTSENHGTTGCTIDRYRTVPASSGGISPRSFVRVNSSDIDASGGVNILDVLRMVGGKGSTTVGPCFNSDLDLNGDGIVDTSDLTIIKGGFNGLP